MKPVIMGAGSCIIGHLLNGVKELSIGDDSFEFYMSRGQSSDGRPPIEKGLLERCTLLIEEASPWYRMLSDEERNVLPPDCRHVLVPTIHFNSLWPLMVVDPRNVPLPHIPSGMIPFSRADRLVLEIMRTEPDRSKWVDKYFSTDISTIVNVARNHTLELNNLFMRESNCDVRVAAYIASTFREKRLFYTHHHPGPDLLSFALIQLLSHPAVRELETKSFSAAVEGAFNWVMACQAPFKVEAAPIHPAVARHFNLPWFSSDMTYPWQLKEYTFEEWVRFCFAYDPKASGAVREVQ